MRSFSFLLIMLCFLPDLAFGQGTLATPTIPATAPPTTPHPIATVGWVEPVTLLPNALPFIAKMDSGARTTSLRAQIESTFTKDDGKEWIRFTLPDEKLPHTLFELPLVRWANIRETDGALQKRAVVSLTFCIAGQPVTGETNLAPRPNFIYPVLIGRNMLAGRFLIDSAREETSSPVCP